LRRGGEEDSPADSTHVNPLRPHYLVYVLDSGDVRLSFAQPKAILQLFRDLASGKSAADETLCDLFDSRTAGGANMSHYDDLVQSALRSIERTFQRRAAASLLSGRDGLLPTLAETPTADASDWDLVTWLAILNPEATSP